MAALPLEVRPFLRRIKPGLAGIWGCRPGTGRRRCGGGPVRDGRGCGPPGRGDPGGPLPPRAPGLRRVRGRPDPGVGCRGSGPGETFWHYNPDTRETQGGPQPAAPRPLSRLCGALKQAGSPGHRQSGHHQPHHPQGTSGRASGRFAAAGSGPGNRRPAELAAVTNWLFEPQGHYRRPRREDPGVSPYCRGPRGRASGLEPPSGGWRPTSDGFGIFCSSGAGAAPPPASWPGP